METRACRSPAVELVLAPAWQSESGATAHATTISLTVPPLILPGVLAFWPMRLTNVPWLSRATKAQEAAPHLHAVQVLEMQLLTETAPTLTSAKCLMHAELQRRQPWQLQPQPQHPQHPHHLTTEIISEEPDGLAVAIAVATAGSIASELPSGSGGNPSLHVISLGTLCIWDPVGALAFAYQHLLGTEQGQETTTFVFRTVDIWHDLTVLGQESQETPMAQGHQICLQGRLTRLYTHQSSSSTTEASNAGMISWYIII